MALCPGEGRAWRLVTGHGCVPSALAAALQTHLAFVTVSSSSVTCVSLRESRRSVWRSSLGLQCVLSSLSRLLSLSPALRWPPCASAPAGASRCSSSSWGSSPPACLPQSVFVAVSCCPLSRSPSAREFLARLPGECRAGLLWHLADGGRAARPRLQHAAL